MKTTEIKHTELPWHSIKNSWAITTIYDQDKQEIICESILDEGDCEAFGQDVMEEKQEANAAFIVKAVNSFEKQKYALWIAHEYMKLHLSEYKAGFSVFDKLEEAIKEAE